MIGVKAQVTKFNLEAARDDEIIDLNKQDASENFNKTLVIGNKRQKGIRDKISLSISNRKKSSSPEKLPSQVVKKLEDELFDSS